MASATPTSTTYPPVFSIGHWTHKQEDFLALLKLHNITRLVDVRSTPGSRFNPQFNQDNLKLLVESNGIEYIHRKLLGGREKGGDVSLRLKMDPSVPECLLKAIGRDDLLAKVPLITGAAAASEKESTPPATKNSAPAPTCALMCSEANWHDCHRQNLIHYLATSPFDFNIKASHIWPDGKLEEHKAGVSQVKMTQKDAETAKALEVLKGAAASGGADIKKQQNNNNNGNDDEATTSSSGNTLAVPLPASSASNNTNINKNNTESKARQSGGAGKKKNRLQ